MKSPADHERHRLHLDGASRSREAGTLTRLVYVSDATIPRGRGHFRAEMSDIMAACERNNPRAGITGVLVYDRGRFIQMLEGPKAAVERVFARICEDTRHTQVTAVLKEPVSRRLFADWAMAFANAGEAPLPVRADGGWRALDRETLLSRLQEIHDHHAVMNLHLADGARC